MTFQILLSSFYGSEDVEDGVAGGSEAELDLLEVGQLAPLVAPLHLAEGHQGLAQQQRVPQRAAVLHREQEEGFLLVCELRYDHVEGLVKQREESPGLTPGGHLAAVGGPRAARDELDGDVGAAHAVTGRPVDQLPRLSHRQPEGVALVSDQVQAAGAAGLEALHEII